MALNVQVIKELPALFKQMITGKTSGGGISRSSSYGQVIIPMLGMTIFIALAFYGINQVRVNGPVYNQLKSGSDIRADILPPPLYTVDAFAVANEAYSADLDFDFVTRDLKFAEVKKLEAVYKERASFWNSQMDAFENDNLKTLYQAAIKSNDKFYKIFNTSLYSVNKTQTQITDTALTDLKNAYVANRADVQALTTEVETATAKTAASSNKLVKSIMIALALLALLILFLIAFFGARQVRTIESAVMMLENDGQANQMAVLNLLDEMGDLADGDLTVRAEVKENITGAIADSINYTIASLRDLVTGINRASEQVNTASGQAQTTSVSLLSAAEKQSKQIIDTTEAVSNMTRSILQVSSNASQASQVAQRSLIAATQGSKAVQNTIAGMNGIREQIQETSKRIKRLGESSQEIGEIVELISDITEQTNILALNAAIQAASAGEAGRGFTVVAEEVQRLAIRSSEATKQIGAIVKTIQTDTNSAVAAMEKSTEGVVEGARLSDAAGKALTEIETVSNSLARLIQSISTATDAQTEVASTVTKNMQQIQEITSQTTIGTKLTAESVGQLNKLAEELRDSVAGFKLA